MEERNGSTRITTAAQLQSLGVVLHMTRHAWEKMLAYCRATDLEVSGFMVIEQDEGDLTVVDAYITKQQSTHASTEMDSTAIAQLQMRLLKEKVIGREGRRLGHFHTHPTFGVFWSGTDMLMRETLRKGTDFYVSVVLNQKGEALCAIDINGDFPMSISNVPIEVEPDRELARLCREEVAKYVEQPPSAALLAGYDRSFAGRRSRPRRIGKDGLLEVEGDGLPLFSDEEGAPESLPEGQVVNNEHGTWQNVGGEIVKIAEPDDRIFTE